MVVKSRHGHGFLKVPEEFLGLVEDLGWAAGAVPTHLDPPLVAQAMGVSNTTVHNWMKSGKLKCQESSRGFKRLKRRVCVLSMLKLMLKPGGQDGA